MNKFCKLIICSLVIFNVTMLFASADSDKKFVLTDAIKERASVYTNWAEVVYTNPATHYFLYDNKYSKFELTHYNREEDIAFKIQEGNKERNNSLYSSAYLPLREKELLWGSASYQIKRKNNLKLTSVSDYNLLYPQIIGDRYLNNTNIETYKFDGGYGYKGDRFSWGVSGDVRAVFEYRQLDSRAQNSVLEVGLKTAISYQLREDGDYGAFLSVGFSRYKQNSDVRSYKNEDGIQQYMMNGPLSHFPRFSDSKITVLYQGDEYNAGFGLFSRKNEGFAMSVNYSSFNNLRLFRDVNLCPYTYLITRNTDVHLSYRKRLERGHSVGVALNGNYENRTGVEYILDLLGNNGLFPIFGEIYQYYSDDYDASFSLLYSYQNEFLEFSLAPFVGVELFDEEFLLPKQLTTINFIKTGGSANISANYRRHFMKFSFNADFMKNQRRYMEYYTGTNVVVPVNTEEFYYKVVRSDYMQRSTDHFDIRFNLDYHFSYSSNLGFYTKVEYAERLIKAKVNRNYFTLILGMNF